MSIYQLGDRWGADWRDEYGRRHRKLCGTRPAAVALDRQMRDAAWAGRRAIIHPQHDASLNLRDAIALFLAHQNVQPNTLAQVTSNLRELVRGLGDVPVASVTPMLLERYQDERARRISPLTQAHQNRTYAHLFRFLAEMNVIARSPAAALRVREPKLPTGRILTYADELDLLASVTPKIRTKLICAIDTGLRLSELNALRVHHLSHRALRCWQTKTSRHKMIPLTPRLDLALEPLRALAPDAFLFGRGGLPLRTSAHTLRQATARGAPRYTWHDMRRTFATRLAEASNNPHVVRILMGHAPQTVTDIYVQPTPEECADAVLRMAEQTDARLHAARDRPNRQENADEQNARDDRRGQAEASPGGTHPAR